MSRTAFLSGNGLPYRGFACPQEGTNDELVSFLATEFARSVTRLLIEVAGDLLAAQSRGLPELLERWSNDRPAPWGAWDSCFGDAYLALQRQELTNATSVAARIVLHLGARGVGGEWAARLPTPTCLRWGRWVLPPSERIAVESDGHVARVTIGSAEDEQTATFIREDGIWQTARLEELPRFGRQRALVLPRRLLSLDGFSEVLEASVEAPSPEMIANLEKAMEIIAVYAPPYASWVERVVHELFLIRPMLQHIQSGSIAKYFGVVHLSASPEVVAVAELLVHEASHQYFHLLNLIDAFDDGSDDKMYYSPAVRKERRLDRIGVAYHAFANVLLFYDACLESGLQDEGYCLRNRQVLGPQVAQLRAPLEGNSALTDIGRSLCEPLIERVDSNVLAT